MTYCVVSCLCLQPNQLRPSAAKAEALLLEALEHDADIPLALHLHIHISEASTPNRCFAKPLCAVSCYAELSCVFNTSMVTWQELIDPAQDHLTNLCVVKLCSLIDCKEGPTARSSWLLHVHDVLLPERLTCLLTELHAGHKASVS